MILMIFVVSSVTIPALAQTSNSLITVSTDKSVYSDGDPITISGTVSTQLNVPISIVVRDPSSNIVLIGQVSPNQGTYSTLVTAGGSLWTAPGTYEVYVTYGSKDNTAKTTFQFTGSLSSAPIVIEGQSYNATYKITNGKVLGIIPDTSSRSITIRVEPTGNGTILITLPRSLMDAKNNVQDSQFIVQSNGIPTSFNETRTDSTSRTLAIPFGLDVKQITIIGTQIVPEFGPVVLSILTIAMLSMIFYFRTNFQIKMH